MTRHRPKCVQCGCRLLAYERDKPNEPCMRCVEDDRFATLTPLEQLDECGSLTSLKWWIKEHWLG